MYNLKKYPVPHLAKTTEEEDDILFSIFYAIEEQSISYSPDEARVDYKKLTKDYFLRVRNALVGIGDNVRIYGLINEVLRIEYDAKPRNNNNHNRYAPELDEVIDYVLADKKEDLYYYYKKYNTDKEQQEKRAKNVYFTLHQTTHLPSNLIGDITEMNTGLKRAAPVKKRKTRKAGGANTIRVPDLAKITKEEYDIIYSMFHYIENRSYSSGRNHAFIIDDMLTNDEYLLKLRNALVGLSTDDPEILIEKALDVNYDAVYANSNDSDGYNYNKSVHYDYELYEILNKAIVGAQDELEELYEKLKANREKRAKNVYYTLHQTTHLPSNLIGNITEMNTGLKRKAVAKKSRRVSRVSKKTRRARRT